MLWRVVFVDFLCSLRTRIDAAFGKLPPRVQGEHRAGCVKARGVSWISHDDENRLKKINKAPWE